MFAIREANRGHGIGGRSADKHSGEWWRGDRWTPASDEAKAFESIEEAEQVASGLSREAVVVEID